MELINLFRYDPAGGEDFWEAIRQIPGYPNDGDLPLVTMIIESGALLRLPEVLADLTGNSTGEVLAVMDLIPMRRGPDELKMLLLKSLRNAGWQPHPLMLIPDDNGQVLTDMARIDGVKKRIQAGIPVLSIGSGVVTDIARHACYLHEQETSEHVPFVAFQTANSVTAYTSNLTPVLVNGVKRTFPSRFPDVIISDLETLCDAPPEMTVAGVGDVMAAFISLADWQLAYRLGMDDLYNEFPYALLSGLDQILIAFAEDIRTGTLEGMEALAKLLHLSGLAMSLSSTSAPLSGYEHAIAHVLDMQNESAGLPVGRHGSLVALTSVACSLAYQSFLDEFDPRKVDLESAYPKPDTMRAKIYQTVAQLDNTGKAAEQCWANYQVKLNRWNEHRRELESFLANWHIIRSELDGLVRSPELILDILRAIDGPVRFEELVPPISEASARFAFFNAPLMRSRLTLGDLLIFLNWDRQKLWAEIWSQMSA